MLGLLAGLAYYLYTKNKAEKAKQLRRFFLIDELNKLLKYSPPSIRLIETLVEDAARERVDAKGLADKALDCRKRLITLQAKHKKEMFGSMSLDVLEDVYADFLQTKSGIFSHKNRITNEINRVISNRATAKKLMNILPSLLIQAKKALPETPFKEKDLKEDEFETLMDTKPKDPIIILSSLIGFETLYNKIIGWKLAEKKKKEQDEEDKKRATARRASSYSGYSSSSSSRSSSSSSSFGGFGGFGGGRSGGGGATGRW
jgi:uncharacterized membrane protein YgcG